VNVRQHLPEVAHVQIRTADRAIPEMVSLGFGDAVSVEASYSAG
jgi:hypothetical protein